MTTLTDWKEIWEDIKEVTIILLVIAFLLFLFVPSSFWKRLSPSGGVMLIQMVPDSVHSAQPFTFFLKDSASNLHRLGTVDPISPSLLSKMFPKALYSFGWESAKDTHWIRPMAIIVEDSARFLEFRASGKRFVTITEERIVPIRWAENLHRETIKKSPFKIRGTNMQSFQDIVALIFGLLFHAVILICSILGAVFIYRLADEPTSRGEKTIRVLATLGGLLLFFLSKAAGLSISEILVESISQYSLTFIVLNTIVPAIMGLVIARYCINSLKRGNNVAMRIIILFGVLLISQFADVYIIAAKQSGFLYTKELLPNISFILAVVFYLIFRYESTETIAPPKETNK